MILAQSIAIGLVVGLAFYELTGLVPGGLVVPGYLALYWDRPVMIMTTVLVALAAWGLVRLTAAYSILYGRRRFVVTVIIGFAVQWALERILAGTSLGDTRIDAIGFIIPGLLAHEMDRQGVVRTILGVVAVSAVVRFILIALGLLGAW